MGKKIGKSVLGTKPRQQKPSKKELEAWEETQKELAEQRKAERKEQEEEVKIPKPSIPGEKPAEEKRPLFGTRILPPLEGDVEVTEVPDKRLKTKKKTRIDIKEVKE